MEEFKSGDVVKIKGQVVKMTVETINGSSGKVICLWYDTYLNLKRESILPGCLTK